MIHFDSDYLKEFTFQIFQRMGCPVDEAMGAETFECHTSNENHS